MSTSTRNLIRLSVLGLLLIQNAGYSLLRKVRFFNSNLIIFAYECTLMYAATACTFLVPINAYEAQNVNLNFFIFLLFLFSTRP